MPEEQIKIDAEPTVDIPTEGDPVDVELKEDSKLVEPVKEEPKIEKPVETVITPETIFEESMIESSETELNIIRIE